ncbi:MAG: hypothetical protein NTX15_01090 [Candidatus Kapabacteria bacterium]|nr:hypothetical protein [Candidatus Kapabacteria bacterium]
MKTRLNLPIIAFIAVSALCAITTDASAWVYPEHRDIALQAVVRLSPQRRMVFDSIWAIARRGNETRLCSLVVEPLQARNPNSLDWASWSAIGGDHSCSPQQLLDNVLRTDWILDVADVAARLKIDLAGSKEMYDRVNALRNSDIRMQRADPNYATRAGSNNVHFLLSRTSASMNMRQYAHDCLVPGAELNALGSYAIFHQSAMRKVTRVHSDNTLTDDQRRDLLLSALADEAFALHFLEDTFASGHVAGTWGETSVRKGTHDYYCEHGMEVTTWDGRQTILLGDAYMRPADAENAAKTIRTSLEQFIDAYTGVLENVPAETGSDFVAYPFNVCQNNVMPALTDIDSATIDRLTDIIRDLPVPGLADGSGALPRFRAELGGFVGFNSGARLSGMSNGFNTLQPEPGGLASLDINLRLGMGLEGVLNASGDGLVFIEGGYRIDGASTQSFYAEKDLSVGGAVTAAIPSRSAYQVRVRMPFWLLPGDLIVAIPLLIFSPQTYQQMAVVAGNGGIIPWQSAIATPIGRFQFMLGRELGATFYGYGTSDRAFMPKEAANGTILPEFVGIQSLYLDVPFIEYKPFRSFASNQSSGLTIQLFTGFDIPIKSEAFNTDGTTSPGPVLQTVVHAGLRFVFDWRYYW